jgi:hypothetical protein
VLNTLQTPVGSLVHFNNPHTAGPYNIAVVISPPRQMVVQEDLVTVYSILYNGIPSLVSVAFSEMFSWQNIE